MKRVFLVILLFSVSLISAQHQDRTRIDGKILVPMGDDPEGIAIVNTTSGVGTISSEAGDFNLGVTVNDTLHFSALQYQEFSVVIDGGVIDSGQLIVEISESIKELPEVVVRPIDLSGYVEVDVMKIPTEEVDLPDISAAEIEDTDYDFRPDDQTSPANPAMRNEVIFSGRNLAEIFRNIFTSRSTSATTWTSDGLQRDLSQIDDEIQQLYDDEFFVEHLGIKRENIGEFIFFAEDNGLDEQMLKEENEVDLIRFLMEQSERYKDR